jgi:regulator of sirC expression with transglutaminase-like and TPR domain
LYRDKDYRLFVNLKQNLDSIAAALLNDSFCSKSASEKNEIIKTILFKMRSIKFTPAVEEKGAILPQHAWSSREGSCLSVTLLYLMLAERLNCLQLYGVILPGHIFIRYSYEDTVFNIEPNREGYSHPDSYYVTRYDVRNSSFYNLKNCTFNEIEAVVAYNVGYYKLMQGKYGEAELLFKKALVRAPGYPAALGNLAIALSHMGKMDSAVAMLKEFVKNNPDDENGRLNLELMLNKTGGNKK